MNSSKKIFSSNFHQLQTIRVILQKPVEVKLLSQRMRELDQEFARQTKQLTSLSKSFAKKLAKRP